MASKIKLTESEANDHQKEICSVLKLFIDNGPEFHLSLSSLNNRVLFDKTLLRKIINHLHSKEMITDDSMGISSYRITTFGKLFLQSKGV